MKRNFISLIVAIGLICALTIGSSADFYGVLTKEQLSDAEDETLSETEGESSSGRRLIDIAGEFREKQPSSKSEQKTSAQNYPVKGTLKK